MKIISVHFLNLNSLKGEHEINFNNREFEQSGLFAITGATGAGKTTILDAITLGLYGYVHRHGKNAEESMTRYTGECYSEVVFEVNGKQYKAKWSIRRGRGKADGNLQSAKMELADATTTDIIVSHPLDAVRKKIIEICGLDYEQFIRSVMLCQGDFTRFLKAKESERSELLEKITDTAIYSGISSFVFRKAKDENNKLQLLEQQIGHIEILSEEAIAELLNQKNSLQQEAKELQQTQSGAEEKINWLQLLNTLQQKIEIQKSEVERLQHVFTFGQPEFAKAALHMKAMVHQAGLSAIEHLQTSIAELIKKKELLQQTLYRLQQDLVKSEEEVQRAANVKIDLEVKLKEMIPVLEQVIALDVQLKSIAASLNQLLKEEASLVADQAQKQQSKEKAENNLQECSTRIEELKLWLGEHKTEDKLNEKLSGFFQQLQTYSDQQKQATDASTELVKTEKQLKLTEKNITDTKQRESAAGLLIAEREKERTDLSKKFTAAGEGKTLDEWQKEKEKYPTRILRLQQQQAVGEKYAIHINAINNCNSQLSVQRLSLHEGQAALMNLLREQEHAEQTLTMLQKIAEQQLLIQKYEEDRSQLQPGSECPLCGSTEHPYVHTYDNSQASEAGGARDKQKQVCKELAIKVSRKGTSITKLESYISELENNQAELEKLIKEEQQTFEASNRQLQAGFTIDDIDSIAVTVKTEQNALKYAESKLAALKEIEQQLTNKDNQITLEQQKLLKAEGDLDILLERESNLLLGETKLKDQLQKLSKIQSETEILFNDFLQPLGIVFKAIEIKELKSALQLRAATYTQYANEWQDKNGIKATLESEGNNANSNLRDITIRLAAHREKTAAEQLIYKEVSAERSRLFCDKDPVAERKQVDADVQLSRKNYEEGEKKRDSLKHQLDTTTKQIAVYADTIKDSQQKLQEQSAAFLMRIQNAGFSTIELLKQAYIDHQLASEVVAKEAELKEHIAAAKRLLEDTEEELNKTFEKNLTNESEDILQQQVLSLRERIGSLNQQIGSIDTQLKENIMRQQRFAAVADDIAKQRKEYERWERLSSIIGSADGKKFRTFAQSLTLMRLTELANRHLQNFTDRYQLIKPDDKELELQIVDRWQADAVRPVTTLSGGESFLVSLSLALGLSDLAGRKIRIESLFIDEGFGSLDSETLDVAISALENLQAGGKMIGIISHVDALKERIATQVEVRKQSDGCSKIMLKVYERELEML